VEDATDGLAPLLADALREWRPGDAAIVVTAGNLTGKSPLKKLFDDSGAAVCICLYDEPPTREEIETELKRAGLRAIAPEAMADLGILARALDPGDFRQTLEKIALYHWGVDAPLSPADVAACAPATLEAEVDDVIHAVAERDQRQVGTLMRRLEGQGVTPVTLCIGAMRHFKALHAAATDGGGAANGLMRARVFGPRRDRMLRQLQGWRVPMLEWALAELLETDLALRSTSKAPAMAVMERALIRLAMAPP
jgi:DNA polymerase-3 subunit delta